MEINKTVILISLLTIIFIGLGNMFGAYYFINRAINLVEAQSPPLTISNNQTEAIKKLIK